MADELDQMLQGADDQTPAPQANQGGQDDVQPLSAPEEVEFNNLSGSTQDRIRELIAEKNKWRQQAESNQPAYVPPAPLTPDNPDVRDAVRKLSEVGMATKDEVNQTVEQKLNQIRWENKVSQMERDFPGTDNSPKFDRVEVEDYIRSHPQYLNYDVEDVFRFKMHSPEDFGSTTPTRRSSSSLRPNKAQAPENAMTVEFIADRTDATKYSDAAQWQEEHKADIDKVLATMS